MDKITQTFEQNKPAFMPYFTLGYPDYETSLAVVQACAAAGADMMELGIPFSDPLADGPTIQHSTQVALQGGMTVERCVTAVSTLRASGITIPFLLMGYINPLLAYGLARFVQDAAQAGANGLIIPDLPPDEAGELEALCAEQGLALVYLLSPNSFEERIKMVTRRSTGFTYLVSVTGITGARTELSQALGGFIRRVRAVSQRPLAVGFGISTPQQAQAVGELADGVIIGSALVKAVDAAKDKPTAAATFVASMKK
ncbi:MAG: tryptophan synthase subunit alpha [Ardenticatenaceae bacterium]|nr:tryptophan synthase subunit alpha [Ardenticatenaceae bacterium]MCB9003373.1 tryptophan synthase subunit alpha [Ardenticatenaceae bacterium]